MHDIVAGSFDFPNDIEYSQDIHIFHLLNKLFFWKKSPERPRMEVDTLPKFIPGNKILVTWFPGEKNHPSYLNP